MQPPSPPSSTPLNVSLGATLVTWLPYLDMGLRMLASLVAIYAGWLYIRKLRSK